MSGPAKKKAKARTWSSQFKRGFDWATENQPSYATGVSLVLVGLSPVIGFAMSRTHKSAVVIALLLAQVVVAVGSWIIPYMQRRRAEKDQVALEADVRIRVGDALDPLFEEIGLLAASTTDVARAKHAERVQTSLLLSAANLIGPSRSRACFFKYVNIETSDGGRVQELRYVSAQGRSLSARQQMNYNKPDGKAMINMIKADETLLVDDVQTKPPEHWDPKRYKGKYRSFISVPVKVKNKRPYGMLTLDSPSPNALDDDDVDFLRLLGRVLAVVIASSGQEATT